MFSGTDPYLVLVVFVAVILTTSLLGAFVPRLLKLNVRQVHLMVALSAGIFLGILFFMLLPETFEKVHTAGKEGMDAVFWIVGGFLAVLLVDVILKWKHMSTCLTAECNDNIHKHETTSFTAFIGLAIHAVVDGIVLSIALSAGSDIAIAALIGISLHKFADVFALSSTFMLTKMEKRKTLIFTILFVLITPVAAILSMPVVNILEGVEGSIFIPLAIATGTFMYVGIYALLPEAFHVRRDSLISFALVVAGIAAIALMALAFGEIE
jgi:zinc transporter ZupT